MSAINFDYTVLLHYKPAGEATPLNSDSEPSSAAAERVNLKQICDTQKIPIEIINETKRTKWIKPEQSARQETTAAVEYEFIKQFDMLLQKGMQEDRVLWKIGLLRTLK